MLENTVYGSGRTGTTANAEISWICAASFLVMPNQHKPLRSRALQRGCVRAPVACLSAWSL